MIRFCVRFSFGSKNIHFFSKFNAENMGKNRGLSVVERTKIVTVNEERVFRKANIKKPKFSKIIIHQAIFRF